MSHIAQYAVAVIYYIQDAAHGFFFSAEMNDKKLGNADFVETLYNVLLGRPSDAAGKAAWVQRLELGISREDVFAWYATSDEFGAICASYGILR